MADERARIDVRVTPRGGRDTIVGWRDGALAVRIAVAPVEGAANASLLKMIAKRLGVPPSSVTLVAGTRSRTKVVEIAGLSDADVRSRIL
ncbi:MAG: DUF167 domain-containing protein [Dehalococcoidia bacterium]